ncbi:MAG: cation transporting ATPase C-terminal domain-containing protein, partial [Allosphingosinicella sp.]
RGFFSPSEWAVIGVTGTAIAGAVMTIFVVAIAAGTGPAHARTMALVCLVSGLAVLLLSLTGLKSWTPNFIGAAAVASSFFLVQIRPLATLAHLHPVPAGDWLMAVGAGAIPALGALIFRRGPALPGALRDFP